MKLDPERLDPPPKRFGACRSCPYLQTGSAPVCYGCALRDIDPLLPISERCARCDQSAPDITGCGNPLCSGLVGQREYDWNFAVGMRSGVLKRVTDEYKFQEVRGWGVILGRLLVGFLDENQPTFKDFDLIIPSPGWTGPGAARSWDHATDVLRWARDAAGDRWPIRLEPVIRRTAAVPPLKSIKAWKARREIAEGPLRSALDIVDRASVNRKRVLVYDDIYTDGLTLREVARALRLAGASYVCGVTLMRQPYRTVA